MAGRPPKSAATQKEKVKEALPSEAIETGQESTEEETESVEDSQESTEEETELVEDNQESTEEENAESVEETEGIEKIREKVGELLEAFMSQLKLVAVIPVLYRSRQYQVGETLPAADKDMVEAWIDSGAAKWIRDMPESVKAKLVSAEPGAIGKMLDDSTGLIGKIERKYGRGL